jgi:hypothetical protein
VEPPEGLAYLALSLSGSVLEAAEPELDGWLELELEPLVAPAPAEPLGVLPEVALELELGLDDAPPPALFFSSVLIEPEAEPEAAPEGEDGVVAPEGDEVEPDEDAAPEGGVLVSRAVRGVPSLSPQAARPRARETAAARIESFMCSPPWLG